MTTLAQAKAKVRDLSQQALDLIDNKSLTSVQIRAELDRIEPEIKTWTKEIQALGGLESKRTEMLTRMGGDPGGTGRPDATAFRSKTFDGPGGLDYRLGNAPALGLSTDDARGAYDASTKGLNYKAIATVKTPVASSGVGPAGVPQQILPPVTVLREPTRLLDLIPSATSDRPLVEWYQQVGKATAGYVAEGQPKPGGTLTLVAQQSKAIKLAGWVDTTNEAIADYGSWLGFLDNEVAAAIVEKENYYLLNGDGSGDTQNIVGLLNTTGIITFAYPGTPPTGYTALDHMTKAKSQLRAGTSFIQPSHWVMSPNTRSSLGLLKDNQGRPLLDPNVAADASDTIGGTPTALTTQIADGTILGANFVAGTRAWVREGLQVVTSGQGIFTDAGGNVQDRFKSNIVTVLGEERIGAFTERPTCFIKLTGVPVS